MNLYSPCSFPFTSFCVVYIAFAGGRARSEFAPTVTLAVLQELERLHRAHLHLIEIATKPPIRVVVSVPEESRHIFHSFSGDRRHAKRPYKQTPPIRRALSPN